MCITCLFLLQHNKWYRHDGAGSDTTCPLLFCPTGGRIACNCFGRIQRINEVTLRQAQLVLGWMNAFGWAYHLYYKKILLTSTTTYIGQPMMS